MKTKAMALIMALMMVLTVTAISVSSIDTDSAKNANGLEINEITTVQMDTTTKSIMLTVNEKEFLGYNYTLSWYAIESNGSNIDNNTAWGNAILTSTCAANDDVPVIAGSMGVAIGGHITVAMSGVTEQVGGSDKPITGKYSVKLTADQITSGTVVDVALKCEMVLTVGGDSKKMTPLYYHIPVKFTSQPGTTVEFTPMTAEVAVPYRLAIESTQLGSIDQFVWYAIDLPDGLSMSSSGYVSGIPTKATEAVPVSVVAINAEGIAYSGTLSVTVNSSTHTTGNYNYRVDVNETPGRVNAQSSLATQGDKVQLRIVQGDFTGGTPADATVTVINSEGEQTTLNSDPTGVYTLETTGTGAYKVKIAYPGGSPVTLTLYVSPALENIAAGIIVS